MTSIRARMIELPAQLTIRPRTTWRWPRRPVSERLWLAEKYIVSLPQVLPRTPLASRVRLPALLAEPLPLPLPLEPLPPPAGVWPVGSQTLPAKPTCAWPAITSSTGVPAAERTFRCIALIVSELPVRTCSSNLRSTASPSGASCWASCCRGLLDRDLLAADRDAGRLAGAVEHGRAGDADGRRPGRWRRGRRASWSPRRAGAGRRGSRRGRWRRRPGARRSRSPGVAMVVADDVRAVRRRRGRPSGARKVVEPGRVGHARVADEVDRVRAGVAGQRVRDRAGAALPRGLGLRRAGERGGGQDGHEDGP